MNQIVSVLPAGPWLKFCRVAAGETDTYLRPGRTMERDTAAGDAVLRVAGGIVVDLDGHPLVYNQGGQRSDVDFANRHLVAYSDAEFLRSEKIGR
ncbi:inositol monophosphatase family protein [Mesorhizobium sp. M1312]|uniref:inositol monophosphatase family protein n=1 Tax=unclassified Mesorhizobium TaxID=325217 RepID=UPI00333B97DB